VAAETELMLTLNFAAASASPNYATRVTKMPWGWAVGSAAFRGEFMRFDSDGNFLGANGTQGEGPGEYQGLLVVEALSEDRFAVVDGAARRISILDGNLEYLDALRIPGSPYSVSKTPNGRLVLGGQFQGRRGRFTVAILEADTLRLVAPSRSSDPSADFPAVMASDSTVWAAKMSGGVLESVGIGSIDTITEYALTLDGYGEIARPRPDRVAPYPQIQDADTDGEGLGMLVTAVADANWRPRRRYPDEMYDTEVLILDLIGMSVVGRARLPGLCASAGFPIVACPNDEGNLDLHRVLW
jgi:hypothetical protein